MTTKELEIKYRTGKSYQTGKHRINRAGNRVEIYEQREAYMIQSGAELWPEEWRGQMKAAIAEEGKQELLSRIVEAVKTHCMWLRTEQEILDYAMDCLAGEAYRAWQDFEALKMEVDENENKQGICGNIEIQDQV